MRLENFISVRYIVESRNNKDISHAALTVIISIALAVIFYIVSVSIMNGYIYGIMKLIFDVKSFHLELPASPSYPDSLAVVERLQQDKRILKAGLYRETKGILSANGKSSGLAFIRAMDEDIFSFDHDFNQGIILLQGEKNLALNQIMISQKTAQKLRLKLGSSVYFIGHFSQQGKKYSLKRLVVSGIFTTGLVEYDEQLALIGKNTGDKIFKNYLDYQIYLKLHDYKRAAQFAQYHELNGFLGIITWEEANYNELTALRFEKNVIALIVIIVIFVAALNILSTIHLTVSEKNEDIAILKSLGYSPLKIINIFLLQGIYLALIGIITGIILGLLLTHWMNPLINGFAVIINQVNWLIYQMASLFIPINQPEVIEFFSKDFYLDKIYTDISYFEIVFISLLTLLFSIFSAIFPAIQAGKIKPNEVIKNG